MLKKSIALALLVSGLMAGGAVSSQKYNASGSYSLGIRGFVPVICRATVAAGQVTPREGVVEIGTMNEFCNSPNGYEIWADYSPSLSEASLVVDADVVELSESGSTRLLKADRAGMARRNLALELPSDDMAGNISFRVVAL